MTEAAESTPNAGPRFEVEAYHMARDYTLYAVFVCLGVLIGIAVGLGYAGSWLIDYIPKFEWIGLIVLILALAGSGWILVGQTRLRHEGITCVIALLAGGLGIGSFYYFHYLRTMPTIETNVLRWLPYRALGMLPPQRERKATLHDTLGKDVPERLRTQLETDLGDLPVAEQRRLALAVGKNLDAQIAKLQHPGKAKRMNLRELPPLPKDQLGPVMHAAVQRAMAEYSLWDYFDWRASVGVELWLPRLKTIHCNYTWSIVYWCVAAVLVVVVPWGTMCIRAERPLCLQCHQWKPMRPLGRFNTNEDEIVRHFKDGTIAELAAAPVIGDGQPGGTVRVQVAMCAECRETSDVQLILERITKNKEEQDEFTEIVKLTYPGESIKVFDTLFGDAALPAAPPPDSPAPTTDA